MALIYKCENCCAESVPFSRPLERDKNGKRGGVTSMPLKKVTLIFILVALVVIIGFDVWTLATNGFESTISATIYEMSRNNPIYAFALGIVCGHLFWPNKLAMRPHE